MNSCGKHLAKTATNDCKLKNNMTQSLPIVFFFYWERLESCRLCLCYSHALVLRKHIQVLCVIFIP